MQALTDGDTAGYHPVQPGAGTMPFPLTVLSTLAAAAMTPKVQTLLVRQAVLRASMLCCSGVCISRIGPFADLPDQRHYSRAARIASARASRRRASSAVTLADRSGSFLIWRISSRTTSAAAISRPRA